MKIKLPNLLKLMPWLCVIVLALLSWYFLMMRNADVLYMQQLRSLFNNTPDFFQQYIIRPAGPLQWLGCYFTQLFYYPALGSTVLFLMWILIFYFMKKALRIPNSLTPLLLIPLVCLLVSEIDLDYWIYYNKNAGYCFSQTLGMLFASLFVLICRRCAEVQFKFSATIVAVFSTILFILFYRDIGIYSMAAAATLGIIMLLERRWIAAAIYIIASVVTPFLFQQVYDTLRSDMLFTAGLPVFESGDVTDSSLTTPFHIALLCLLAFTLLYKVEKRLKTQKVTIITSIILLVLVTAGSIKALSNADYPDENYHAECKAYRAIDDMQWEDALDAIRHIDGTLTRQLIMFKNIALFNTHDIGNSMYCYDDKGMVPTTRDSLKVNMANTAAPIIYLHHGMTNYAYRWCMELQVDFGFNVGSLKIMSLCAIMNNEGNLAEKYLNILSHTMFYKDWAKRYMPLAHNPKLISKYPELANIYDLHSHIKNYPDTDEGICENYIMHYFSNSSDTSSKYFQEMTLAYSVMSKVIARFWPRYLQYLQLHKGEEIPVVYQQAAYLYNDLEPQTSPDAATYGLQYDKQKIIDRYSQFDQQTQSLVNSGLSDDAIGRQMKGDFGDTFWWAYYFNHGSMCY